MTIKYFLSEARRFLGTEKPEILCITGKWGIGKTFGWNLSLKAALEGGELALSKYAYVSLFGKNMIDDIKMSIVENSTEEKNLGGEPDLTDYGKYINKTLNFVKKKHWLTSFFPGSSEFLPALNRLLFMGVKKQILCLDDLERMGQGVQIQEILGLISDLKENKSCKIVLLFNEDAMNECQRKTFKSQLEKVVNVILEFNPTSAESVDIALNKHSSFYPVLRECCLTLNLVNIRVIKKIENICYKIEEIVSPCDERLMRAAVRTAALAAYAHLQPTEAPSLNFIRTFDSVSDLITKYGNDKDRADSEAEKKSLLRRYGFNSTSHFDAAIIDGIERGAFDPQELKDVFGNEYRTLKIKDKNNAFEAAWSLFRRDFRTPENCILNSLISAIKENYEAISPAALSHTLQFLKDFGREQDALDALQVYVSHRVEPAEFWNLEGHMQFDRVADLDVRAAFAKKFAELAPPPPNPATAFKAIANRNGWSPEQIASLAAFSVADIIHMFKNTENDELQILIPAALYFRDIGNPTPEMKTITLKSEAALYEIAKLSKMHARRVKYWGLDSETYKTGENQFIMPSNNALL